MQTNDVLDRTLTEYPGLKQAHFVENAEFIRFTAGLAVRRLDDDRPHEIFLLFTQNEFRDVALRHDLEGALRRKITRNAFTDANHSNLIESKVFMDSHAIWRASTVDGMKWTFDNALSKWIKNDW